LLFSVSTYCWKVVYSAVMCSESREFIEELVVQENKVTQLRQFVQNEV
jgi:hypothetical protein